MSEPDTGWQLAAKPSIKATGGTERRLLADWMADIENLEGGGGSVIAAGSVTSRPLTERFAAIFDPMDFGALINGALSAATGQNDAAAWQLALDAAAASGTGAIVCPSRGATRISRIGAQLIKPIGVSIDFNGVCMAVETGLDGSSVIVGGDADISSDQAFLREVWMERIGGASTWGAGSPVASDAFLNLEDLQSCQVHIRRLRGKTTGIYLPRGSQYVHFFIDKIIDCKYGFYCTSSEAGFSNNENQVYGGSFRINSSTNVTLDVYGFYFTYSGAGYQFPNNWKYYGPSFEFNRTSTGIGTPFYFNAGLNHRAYDIRHESNNGPVLEATGPATKIAIGVGYAEADLSTFNKTDTSVNGDNFIFSDTFARGMQKQGVWDSGRLVDQLYCYNATDVTFGPGKLGLLASGDTATGAWHKSRVFAGVTPRHGYVEIFNTGTGIAFEIDTTVHKAFWLFAECESSAFGGRWAVNLYDDNHEVVDVTPLASSSLQTPGLTTHSANFGGSWQTGADSNAMRFIRVGANIKSVRVIKLGGGSASCRLRSMGVAIADGHVVGALNISGDPQWGAAAGLRIGTAVGTYGLYTRGQQFMNAAATSVATSVVSVCTLSGRLAPAHPGNSAAVLANAYYTNNGNVYWVLTAGTTGVATPPTASDPTAEYTDGTAVWKYECPLATFAA